MNLREGCYKEEHLAIFTQQYPREMDTDSASTDFDRERFCIIKQTKHVGPH